MKNFLSLTNSNLSTDDQRFDLKLVFLKKRDPLNFDILIFAKQTKYRE